MVTVSGSKQAEDQKGSKPSKNHSAEARKPLLNAFSLRLRRSLPYAGWAFCLSLSIFAAWRLYVVFEHSPLFTIEQIEQRGCKRLKLETLSSSSGIERGQNLLALKSGDVSRRLEKHPWIRRASVVKRFPGLLLIKVAEREPVAVIKIRKALYYLDEEGMVFHRLSAGDSLDFPVITGLENFKGTFGRRGEAREIRKVLSLLRVLGGSTILGRTSEISVDSLKGLIFYLEVLPVPMHIGWDNYLEKRERLEIIFSQLTTEESELKAVDLRFSGQIVLQHNILGEHHVATRERKGPWLTAVSMSSAW